MVTDLPDSAAAPVPTVRSRMYMPPTLVDAPMSTPSAAAYVASSNAGAGGATQAERARIESARILFTSRVLLFCLERARRRHHRAVLLQLGLGALRAPLELLRHPRRHLLRDAQAL